MCIVGEIPPIAFFLTEGCYSEYTVAVFFVCRDGRGGRGGVGWGGVGWGAVTGIDVGAVAGACCLLWSCTCDGLVRVRACEGQDFTASLDQRVTASPRHHCTTLKC